MKKGKAEISNSMLTLGRMLIEKGSIGAGKFEEILSSARGSNDALLDGLAGACGVSDKELLSRLAGELKVPFIELDYYIVDPVLCRTIPTAMAFSLTVLPLHRGSDFLTLVMADPMDVRAIDDIEFMTGLKVRPVLARSHTIQKRLEEAFKGDITDNDAESWYDGENEEPEPETTAESLALRLFNAIVQRLTSNEVDRIHIESKERELRIIEIKDGIHSQFAPDHGPLKVDSPDTREIVDRFIAIFKHLSNPPFNADILPREAEAVIGYQNKNLFLKLNFDSAPDGDGLLIGVNIDSGLNKRTL